MIIDHLVDSDPRSAARHRETLGPEFTPSGRTASLHLRTLRQYIASHDTHGHGVSLSYAEIADILELTVSAARHVVNRAIASGTLIKAADFADCGRRSPNRYSAKFAGRVA